MKKNIRVFLVDDHEVAREGLRRMLELEQDIEIVGEASGAEEALGKLGSISSDVILMDIHMPTINGLEATRLLKSRGVTAEIVIVSLGAEYLAEALEAGAGGYLVKDLKRAELISAIRRVTQGELVLGGSVVDSREVTENALSYLRNAAAGKPNHSADGSQIGSLRPAEGREVADSHREPEAVEAKSYLQRLDNSPVEMETPAEIPAVTEGPVEGVPGPGGVPEPSDSVPLAQPVVVQEWADTDTTRYQWDVELVVEPPVDAVILLRFCGWLRTTVNAEIEEMMGSRDGDSIFKLRLRKRVPLEDILWDFPDMASVREDLSQGQSESRRFLKRRKQERPAETIPTKRLRLVLQEKYKPKQLALSFDSPA
ncbi:MAG: response regulator transcription factor [Chloroflexi bacterium]|nr:response regulator transcription factor [Chloroflexota bacterium]